MTQSDRILLWLIASFVFVLWLGVTLRMQQALHEGIPISIDGVQHQLRMLE